MAAAPREVPGNPVMTRPESGIGNCFPGLECDLRNLEPGNTTTMPTAAWLTTANGPTGAFGHERQLGPVFDGYRLPYAGGFFLGDYESLAGYGNLVRPLFVASTNTGPAINAAGFSTVVDIGGASATSTAESADVQPRATSQYANPQRTSATGRAGRTRGRG